MKRRTLSLALGAALISLTPTREASASGATAPVSVHFDDDAAAPDVVNGARLGRRVIVTREDGRAVAATIEQRLYRAGRMLEKRGAGKVAWLAVREGVKPDFRPEVIELPIASALPDGYYAEQIRASVTVEGAERAVPVRVYRYYSIQKGQRTPLTAKEYSAATTIVDEIPDARGSLRAHSRGAGVQETSIDRRDPQIPQLLELNDTGRPNRSEAGQD
jgi:hypothetical protein